MNFHSDLSKVNLDKRGYDRRDDGYDRRGDDRRGDDRGKNQTAGYFLSSIFYKCVENNCILLHRQYKFEINVSQSINLALP